MVAKRGAMLGVAVGGLSGLLMGALVALTGPCLGWMNWLGMLEAWTVGGAISGLIASVAAQVVGEFLSISHTVWTGATSPQGRSPLSRRRAIRSRRFWSAFFIALYFGPWLSILVYCGSRGAHRTDGFELVGWPFSYFARGGFSCEEHYDLLGLAGDIAVWIAMATAGGLIRMDGFRRFYARVLLLLRNAIGASRRFKD
ncbi:MAG: hypothetical protein ABFC96_11795 [Thermoguttaceae bacterium]